MKFLFTYRGFDIYDKRESDRGTEWPVYVQQDGEWVDTFKTVMDAVDDIDEELDGDGDDPLDFAPDPDRSGVD